MTTRGKLIRDRVNALESVLVLQHPLQKPTIQKNVRNSSNNKNKPKLLPKPATAPTTSQQPVRVLPSAIPPAPRDPTPEAKEPLLASYEQATSKTAAVHLMMPCRMNRHYSTNQRMSSAEEASSPPPAKSRVQHYVSAGVARPKLLPKPALTALTAPQQPVRVLPSTIPPVLRDPTAEENESLLPSHEQDSGDQRMSSAEKASSPPPPRCRLRHDVSVGDSRPKLRPAPIAPTAVTAPTAQQQPVQVLPSAILPAPQDPTAEANEPLLPSYEQATSNMAPVHLMMPCNSADQRMSSAGKASSPPPARSRVWHYVSAGISRLENVKQTKRSKIIFSLLIIFGILLLFIYIFMYEVTDPAELDEYFHSLHYSPAELLVYQGDTLDGIPKGGLLNGSSCILVDRGKHSLSNGKSDIGVVSSNQHLTFPGSLLLANSHLVENSPDVVAVSRAPITYTINLPGLTEEGSFTIVPTYREYQRELNKVLNTWFEKYPNRSVAAHYHSVHSFAYSKQLLRVTFGLDFMNSIIETGINYNAMNKAEKLIKLYKFSQVFYTVSVEPTKTPSDLFDSTVTLKQIKRKTNEKYPPVLIDSVSYGRVIYLKIETSSVDRHADLNVTFKGFGPGMHFANDLKDLNIEVYVIGGATGQTDLIHVKSMDEVYKTIEKFSNLSKNNVGFPIFYSSQFIKDNQKAVVHLTTDYIEPVYYDICRKGVIKLMQEFWPCKWGCMWEVTWTEYSFDQDGNKVPEKKGWDSNSRYIKFKYTSEDIEIPFYVNDLRVKGEGYTYWNSWRTVIDRRNIPVIDRRTFHINKDFTGSILPPITN